MTRAIVHPDEIASKDTSGEKSSQAHAGPTHVAYTVKDLGKDRKAKWIAIGAAFTHRDGEGCDLKLDALPVDGRIVLRSYTATARDSNRNEQLTLAELHSAWYSTAAQFSGRAASVLRGRLWL